MLLDNTRRIGCEFPKRIGLFRTVRDSHKRWLGGLPLRQFRQCPTRRHGDGPFPGHGLQFQVERVVERHRDYLIVEKTGAAGVVAEQTQPDAGG